MGADVIYFPNIRVPESPWFTQVLLYWDSVTSIVPIRFWEQPERLGSFMRDLVSAQLVIQVPPDHRIIGSDDFVMGFLGLLKGRRILRGATWRMNASKVVPTKIHREKTLTSRMLDELVGQGLARVGADPEWIEMEKQVAIHYMGYLATVMGCVNSPEMDPIGAAATAAVAASYPIIKGAILKEKASRSPMAYAALAKKEIGDRA